MSSEGFDRLWLWFGLSRASFLVLPRVLMHEMPDEWQEKMASLLEQYDDTFDDGCDFTVSVSAKRGNKYVEIPEWLKNYRRPDMERIDKARLGLPGGRKESA